MKNNAKITAQKNEKGFITLFIEVNGIKCSVKVNDYNGQYKARAKALTYKIYKCLEEGEK